MCRRSTKDAQPLETAPAWASWQARRRESRLDPCKPLIDGILRADPDAPAEQRHTAQRIFDRLTFNGALIQTGTESYLLAHTKALAGQTAAG